MTWIVTAGGRRFPLRGATTRDLHVDDVAGPLSRICRFGGHVRSFYSVAQHCVLVSSLVHERALLSGAYPDACRLLVREALLHDATEAYLGDVVTPIKRMLPEYAKLEDPLDALVRAKWGLPATPTPIVKWADGVALAVEARALCAGAGHYHAFVSPELADDPVAKERTVEPWAPPHAERAWRDTFAATYTRAEWAAL